jgi:UDP-galactose transporter B1
MLLSVVMCNHKLAAGQWTGAGIVFAGISVEAYVKRGGELNCQIPLPNFPLLYSVNWFPTPEIHAKRVAQEQEKAKIKEL